MIVTFCGHSDFYGAYNYEKKILDVLEDKIGEKPALMYLGNYGDFDQLAYSCCKKYKQTHPKVSLVFVTPYITLEYQKYNLNYEKLRYDQIVYPPIEDKPLRFAIYYRNRWMVEQADLVIAGIKHSWGGAYKTYRYAKSKKKPVFNVCGYGDLSRNPFLLKFLPSFFQKALLFAFLFLTIKL